MNKIKKVLRSVQLTKHRDNCTISTTLELSNTTISIRNL
jgi:hypothetical protein